MSRLLTWVLRLLPAVGVLLFLVGAGTFGALPDSWWDPKGFVVNLASGLTAACFGIPLAFFLIRWLVQDQERRAEVRKSANRARAEIRHVFDGLQRELGPNESIEEMRQTARSVGEALIPLAYSSKSGRDTLDGETVRSLQGEIQSLFGRVAFMRVTQRLDRVWAAFQHRWSLVAGLAEETRPEVDIIDQSTESEFHLFFSADNPIRDIMRFSDLPLLDLVQQLIEAGGTYQESLDTWDLTQANDDFSSRFEEHFNNIEVLT